MSSIRKNSLFAHDLSIVALSIIIAFVMIKTNLLTDILNATSTSRFIGSFVSGMFFTSIFTTAPALVALGEISKVGSIIYTAFFGAIGAVVGDLVIFGFIRDRLSEHFVLMVKHDKWWKRIRFVFKLKYFRWLTFLIGGIILASPFPDELGISILGFSKMRTTQFILISFVFNFIGIFIIGLLANSI